MPNGDQRRILEGASRYRAWAQATMRAMVEMGYLDQRRVDAMRRRNPNYVDMHLGHYLRTKVNDDRELARRTRELVRDKGVVVARPGGLWKTWEGIVKSSEQVGRMAEFRRARAKAKATGATDYEADLEGAFCARQLLDFDRDWIGIAARQVPWRCRGKGTRWLSTTAQHLAGRGRPRPLPIRPPVVLMTGQPRPAADA